MAANGGEIDDILAEVASHGARHVCVTGGEPLAQKRCIGLLQRLCDAGYDVSLETSGAIDISEVDPRVSRVLDIKTPGSMEVASQPVVEPAAAHPARPGQVRDLLARGLRLGQGRRRRASPDRGLRRAVLAELQPDQAAATWPTGSSPTSCRCASSCSCTRSCGTTNRGAEVRTSPRMRGSALAPSVLGSRFAGMTNPAHVQPADHEESRRPRLRRHGLRRRHRASPASRATTCTR